MNENDELLAVDFNDLTFERAMETLQAVVRKMEDGQLPLEAMTRYFEMGKKLSAFCAAKLDEIERKVEVLVREDETGGQWRDAESAPPQPPPSSTPF